MIRLPIYILAGGRSRRFGRDKARAVLEGQPLLQHVAAAVSGIASRLTVVAERPGKYDDLGLRTIGDTGMRRGPLEGLLAALADLQAPERWLLLAPCDVLGLQARWIEELLVAPRDEQPCHAVAFRADDSEPGPQWEPLPALYHRDLHAVVGERLQRGDLALQSLLRAVDVRAVRRPSSWQHVINVNTSDDLAAWLAAARARD